MTTDSVRPCQQAAATLQKISTQYHVSVSRTVALRYAQVDEIVSSLRHRLRKLSKWVLVCQCAPSKDCC